MGQNLTTLKVCHRGGAETATAKARKWGRDLHAAGFMACGGVERDKQRLERGFCPS